MEDATKPTILLDVSKGLGFSVYFHPFIGKAQSEHYPLFTRFRTPRPTTGKKRL